MRHVPHILLYLALFVLSGCDSNNPVTSTRSIDRLVVGTWVVPKTGDALLYVQGLDDWQHVIFSPDGTFSAPWGIAGPRLPEFKGQYWVKGDFLGARGPGGALGEGGPIGEGRLHVQFARIALTYLPDLQALGLVVTEIQPDYIASLGKGAADDLSPPAVRNILNTLNDAPLPESAFGEIKTYQKIERPPSF